MDDPSAQRIAELEAELKSALAQRDALQIRVDTTSTKLRGIEAALTYIATECKAISSK